MRDFTLDGATTLAEVPARSFESLKNVSTAILSDMFVETEQEIALVPEIDLVKASEKNGNKVIRAALISRGVDPQAIEGVKRRPAYLDAGMYLEQRSRLA